MYFQVELRLGIRQLFPRFADLPRLLFAFSRVKRALALMATEMECQRQN